VTLRDPNEPERWIISADAPPELKALLEVARREGPSLAQKVSLGSRLGLNLQQALIGFGSKGVAVGTIVIAAATGAGLGLSSGRQPLSHDHSEPSLVAAAKGEGEISSQPPEAPADAAPPELQAPEAEDTPAKASAPRTPLKRPREAALIRSARDALPANTAQARALLERHRRLHPDGQLAQEREVLWIEVLRLEGRQAEASARALEFRQKNPNSAHKPVAHKPAAP